MRRRRSSGTTPGAIRFTCGPVECFYRIRRGLPGTAILDPQAELTPDGRCPRQSDSCRAGLTSTGIRTEASPPNLDELNASYRHQIDTTLTLVFLPWLGKNAKMNTKLNSPAAKNKSLNNILVIFAVALLSLTLLLGASCQRSSSPPGAPRDDLAVPPGSCSAVTLNIDPAHKPWLPPPDINGGAASASLQDAGVFAWQEFIALNWPAVPQTGQVNTRDQPDPSVPFGSTSGPRVWHILPHKVDIFPGMD